MQLGTLVFLSVLLLVGKPRSFVDGASLSLHPNSADDLKSAFKNSRTRMENPQQSVDEDVRELHSLRPFTDNLISMEKSSSRLVTNINGHKEAHMENKEQVSHNGAKVGSIELVADAKDVPHSATPATHMKADVDLPAQGVHRTFESTDKRKVIPPTIHQDAAENMVDGYRSSYTGIQYSPLDMAEYVFWTGDEKGVTMAIEEFLQDGLMTREEAIAFLQNIKINLDYLQSHYAEERFQRQEIAKERANQMQKALSLEKFTESKMAAPSELSELRQQMRENLSKKNSEVDDSFSPTVNRVASSLTEDDYQDLLERLRMADFLYTEYSLEEVIYQLAKVMFSQSLTRGSSEAQEVLQKFTGFLEAEAENGRISRSLEKKVLDVLISSLTDTLSEHPELVSAARAGLGGDLRIPSASADTLERLLALNKAQRASASGMDPSSHRFTEVKTGPGSGEIGSVGSIIKKSAASTNP